MKGHHEARLCRQPRRPRFDGGVFGQNAAAGLGSANKPFMTLSFARKAALRCCGVLFLLIPAMVSGQAPTNYYAANGTEYGIIGSLPGDQVWPDVALGTNGGFAVWQDNATDGSGWGVSAQRVDDTLSGTLSAFRVNAQGTNDQEHARVAMLKNGGAAFAWQGGVAGLQHIYARFMSASNIFLTDTDVVVSTFTSRYEVNPAVAALNNSNAVVVWSSFDRADSNSLLDVYGQMFSPTGQSLGTNFLINTFTPFNQRTPAVAALAGGGFVAVWISEQERVAINGGIIDQTNGTASAAISQPSVDVYARLFNSNGVAQGGEFLVNSNYFPCAQPSVAGGSDGGFVVTWTARDLATANNSMDVYARTYSSAGAGGLVQIVNTNLYGDQYASKVSSLGADYLFVWTSLGQDGSREGVFGRFMHSNGAFTTGEFLVNTTTLGQQLFPAIASDGVSQFVAVWTSFTGTQYGMDLFAQRYKNTDAILEPMAAPFVWPPFTLSGGVYQPQLQVSWAALAGISVSNYEVYVDGAATNIAATTGSTWTMTAANGLTTNATHTFAVDYVTTAGYRSPMSPSAGGTTWSGQSWGGIPFEWMQLFYGPLQVSFNNGQITYNWPSPNTPLAQGGLTPLQVFMSGGSPVNPDTWLQTSLAKTSQGLFLSWNPQPGHFYQVQVTTNLMSAGGWSNLGAPRFAAGASDSIYVGTVPTGFYRIQFLY